MAGRSSIVEPTAFDEVLLMRISPRKEENDFALLREREDFSKIRARGHSLSRVCPLLQVWILMGHSHLDLVHSRGVGISVRAQSRDVGFIVLVVHVCVLSHFSCV